jgi:t-SNARE complex subunit (syntaxin)
MPSASADIEAGMLGSGSSQSPAMTSFFDEVSAVKQNMQTIKYNIKLIEQSHGECLTAISSEQQRECTDRLEGLMKETNAAAQTVRVRV